MARIEQVLYGYDPRAFVLSADARDLLRKRFAVNFTDDDFKKLEEVLAVCEGVWRARKSAFDRAALLIRLRKIQKGAAKLRKLQKAAATLHRLLNPTSGIMGKPDLSDPLLVLWEDAVKRIRVESVIADGDEGWERAAPDVVSRLSSDLAVLESSAAHVIERVESLETLTQGGDSEHHEYLLTDLMPIAACHRLQTSFTTPIDNSDPDYDPKPDLRRTSELVELACSIAALATPKFPTEIAPTPNALVSVLVRLKAKQKKAKIKKE